MNKKGKALAGIFAVLLVGLIVWAVNGIPEPPDVGDTPSQRIVNFDGNTISEEKNGKIIWTVTAENIEMDIDTKDASLINVKAVYNFEDGRTVELKAPKAIYKEKDHHLEITDGVEGKSSDGGKFSCKEVEWLSDKDMLAMKGDAKIEYEKEHIKASGDRIESTNGFTKFKAIGKAHLEKGKKE
ncbi:MAG: LPS export ABC transporter periplasmic protein LptC [Anaerovibrio sp.]|uniref:LPS export ABC transporter periplasmic protein LptC n=1 Tax=Anaerovibrio lipolyticus TaxID=82374 RepID=UPI001B158853|nr:LPS export ABC transporter periplasmic protein LptC [Anaerovibrio lipolyticus]MBO5588938.1 LPS export ABC transporter periplasmic protein LptC [Anaerovibrio sp.]